MRWQRKTVFFLEMAELQKKKLGALIRGSYKNHRKLARRQRP
jgi:hypothetical protein